MQIVYGIAGHIVVLHVSDSGIAGKFKLVVIRVGNMIETQRRTVGKLIEVDIGALTVALIMNGDIQALRSSRRRVSLSTYD